MLSTIFRRWPISPWGITMLRIMYIMKISGRPKNHFTSLPMPSLAYMGLRIFFSLIGGPHFTLIPWAFMYHMVPMEPFASWISPDLILAAMAS